MMPSQRLKLTQRGFSEATAYDFDLAIMSYALSIESALHETVDTLERDKDRAPKGMHHAVKPRYTLRELLTERTTPSDDEPIDIPAYLSDFGGDMDS